MVYNLPPLEEQQHGGWLMAFVRTWLEACFRPMNFFDAVGRGKSLFEPLVFGVIIGWFVAVVTSLMSLAGVFPMLGFLGAIADDRASVLLRVMSQAAWVVVYILCCPSSNVARLLLWGCSNRLFRGFDCGACRRAEILKCISSVRC